jgi:VWFA-related protein
MERTVIKARASFLLALLLCASGNAAQTVQPTQSKKQQGKDEPVKLKAELVNIHAVVTDKQGRIIDNLKKEDFELAEEGRPQDISFFSSERVGPEPSDQTAAPKTSAETPKAAARSVTPLRTIVLFVDTLHMSPSNLIRTKQTLKQFIDERMTDRDIVLIVTSGGASSGFEQFTQDRQLLHHLIDRIAPWQSSTSSRFTPYLAGRVKQNDPDAMELAIAILQGEDGLAVSGLPRNMIAQMVEAKAFEVLAQAEYRRRVLLSVLRAVADGLTSLSGQRLIMFLSDGFTMMDTNGGFDGADLQAAISRSVRSGVKIYSLDAKGLDPPAGFDVSSPSVATSGRSMTLLWSFMSASEQDVLNGMNALASDTGGRLLRNTNDLKGSLQKAVDDNRAYYVLAYYPSDLKDNGKFRRITIRVRSHPDYKVRAQSGYLISDFTKNDRKETGLSLQQRLFQAIASPLPVTNLKVGASANHLEVDYDTKQISFESWIDGASLTYREQNGRASIELEVATVVYDRTGQQVSTRLETIRGDIPVERIDAVKRTGFRYTTRIAVKPGRYQVRIGVCENETERIGTAITWVEVPRVTPDKLALSDIILSEGADETQRRLTAATGAAISPRFGIRYFTRDTFLVYQLMIYAAPSAYPESALLMQCEITKGGKIIYQTQREPIASRLVAKQKKGFAIGGQIRLAMEPGIYDLQISITHAKSGKTTREGVTFGIEP